MGVIVQLPLLSRSHIIVVVNSSLFTAPQFAPIDVVISGFNHNITIISIPTNPPMKYYYAASENESEYKVNPTSPGAQASVVTPPGCISL
jgi:hypothetical protein